MATELAEVEQGFILTMGLGRRGQSGLQMYHLPDAEESSHFTDEVTEVLRASQNSSCTGNYSVKDGSQLSSVEMKTLFVVPVSFGGHGRSPPPCPITVMAHPHQISKLDPFSGSSPSPSWGLGFRNENWGGNQGVSEATGTHKAWEHKPEEMEYLFIKSTKVHYGHIDLYYNPQRVTIFKALNPTQIQFYM